MQIKDNINRQKSKKYEGAIETRLTYELPYDWDYMMTFFNQRAIPGIERVVDNKVYQRSLSLVVNEKIYTGWIEVNPIADENMICLTIGGGLINVVEEVTTITKKVFDLELDPEAVIESLPKGIRIPGCFDPFEMAVRAILGQQITVKAAMTIAGRVVNKLGEEVQTPWEEINRKFPHPAFISKLEEDAFEVLGILGVIRTKTTSILSLAKGIHHGNITFCEEENEFRTKMLNLKGIGPWTVEYLLMRSLGYRDAFPVTDVVIKKAMMTFLTDENGVKLAKRDDLSRYKMNKLYEKQAIDYSEKYKPWRSYYTLSLWKN